MDPQKQNSIGNNDTRQINPNSQPQAVTPEKPVVNPGPNGAQPNGPANTYPQVSPSVQATPVVPASPSAMDSSPEKSSKKFVILLVVVALLLAGAAAWWFMKPKNSTTQTNTTGLQTTTTTPTASPPSASKMVSFDAVVTKFITAMQTHNKAVADSLESPAYQAKLKKQNQTTSFYSMCTGYGEICTLFFSQKNISSSTKSSGTYVAANGAKGKKIIYASKSSSNNGQGGQGQSSSSLVFDGVPKGNSWLIDNIDFGANVSASQN